ncbi:hypothetical protein Tmar_1131 [Thermaerobacter marianensis DSM 12885]|uniref:DUF2953 domain-containing protein n=1 Tax=Thermaerobacter marianensis (strain ATCC 700841 / DSM 12885 / JCM 10246 / 7p75a) TaxID=644966 RepID=E6SKN6_THEM7|nr:hypothetical protein [Thermaerobacter marianensis]ADU51244.1 hypothetical protein Tmar_1131 [Thermaerobacter marianensis DSM 12885]
MTGRPGFDPIPAALVSVLAVAAILSIGWLLHRPLLPLRLRVRWRAGRLTATLEAGWPCLTYRYRVGWRPPGPLQLRRSLRLPPAWPRRRALLYRRRVMPGPPWPLTASARARRLVRLLAGGEWRVQKLSLHLAVGLADAAATAWVAGSLSALAGAAAAAAGHQAMAWRIRVEPAFGRPAWALDLDCIARIPLWEAMSAARALRTPHRPNRTEEGLRSPGRRSTGRGRGSPGPDQKGAIAGPPAAGAW